MKNTKFQFFDSRIMNQMNAFERPVLSASILNNLKTSLFLQFAAENLAVREFLDYIAKSLEAEMYPKERESYWEFRRSFDIEKVAKEKYNAKQVNSLGSKFTSINLLFYFSF